MFAGFGNSSDLLDCMPEGGKGQRSSNKIPAIVSMWNNFHLLMGVHPFTQACWSLMGINNETGFPTFQDIKGMVYSKMIF
jgi:hypothetical protein